MAGRCTFLMPTRCTVPCGFAAQQATEEFLGLDGKTYKPTADHFVIADDNGPESLAGIMGGEDSGCSLETTNVLVESALWDPLTIARTGRDSRHQYRCPLSF